MLQSKLTAVVVAAAIPLLVISAAAQAAPAAPSHPTAHAKAVHPLPVSGHLPVDTLHSGTANPARAGSPGTGDTGAGDTVTVTNNPGTTETPIYITVKYQFTGTSSGGDLPLSWSATGLPPQVTISSSGLMSGDLDASSPGSYTVTVTATDTSGATGQTVFSWTVDNGYPLDTVGKCLDDSGAGTTNGNKIDIWGCNFTLAQTWRLNPDGTLHLILGKCLTDPSAGGTRTGLVLDTCVGGKTQKWHTAIKHKQLEFVLASNGLCLTDPSGSTKNGTQVEVRDCTGASDQLWGVF